MTAPPADWLGGSARFRFHGDLDDHLPPERVLVHSFGLPASVKDPALGVPHPEVDLILANGEAVGFSYRVADGDRLDVYPDAPRCHEAAPATPGSSRALGARRSPRPAGPAPRPRKRLEGPRGDGSLRS